MTTPVPPPAAVAVPEIVASTPPPAPVPSQERTEVPLNDLPAWAQKRRAERQAASVWMGQVNQQGVAQRVTQPAPASSGGAMDPSVMFPMSLHAESPGQRWYPNAPTTAEIFKRQQ